jgi:hypothetical protein
MNALRQALVDYLAVRRALGYKLARTEKLLAQFLTYLEDRCECQLTTRAAVAWATLPAGAHRSWMSIRLSVVRRFAVHLRGIDPATEVPPAELLPWQKCLVALMTAAETLRASHRIATYRTLIGLLALDRDDFDAINGLLVVRNGKFGKSRELPLHASSVSALTNYLQRTDRPLRRRSTSALFVSTAGTRLLYTNVQNTFHRLVRCAGLTVRSASCRPRLHDIRHYSGNRIIPAPADQCT